MKGILSRDTVIKRFRKIHGNKYDYSKMVYLGSNVPIIITCPIHGDFEKKPRSHSDGAGCFDCELDRRSEMYRLPLAECISRLNEKYNGRYEYSKLSYTNAHDDIIVTCKTHGDFVTCLDTHLRRGSNCTQCMQEESPRTGYYQTIFDRNEKLANTMGAFYVIRLSNDTETFYKVGITKNNVSTRYHQSGTPGYKRETIIEEPMLLKTAFVIEQYCRTHLTTHVPQNKFDGYTECVVEWPYLGFYELKEHMEKQGLL